MDIHADFISKLQWQALSNLNLALWKKSAVNCFNRINLKIGDLAQNKHIYERMREHFRDQRGAAVILHYREAWASNLYSDASPFKYG